MIKIFKLQCDNVIVFNHYCWFLRYFLIFYLYQIVNVYKIEKNSIHVKFLKRSIVTKQIITILAFLILISHFVFGHKVKESRLEIFIDCNYCDIEYLKTALPFINIVIEKEASDIHLLFNRNRTGSGGFEHTITAYGNEAFDNLIDTTRYYTESFDTYEVRREKMANGIKASLIKFLIDTPLRTKIDYEITGKDSVDEIQDDPWDNWVFRTRLQNSFNKEATSGALHIYTSIAARRVTQDWKLLFRLMNYYIENSFDYDDENITQVYRSQSFYTYAIKSLTDHWSIGLWGQVNRSSYSNIGINYGITPGIEYNIFPYSDYNTRQFRIEYKWEFDWTKYNETTIYFKDKETRIQQAIFIGFDLIKPWGNILLDLKGSHYIHDVSLYSIHFSSRLSVNIVKGLSIDFQGYASAIHDQINLPIQDASLEEVLLQQKELETQFRFRGSIGFSYFFGSIYNNTVNPRFGD